MHPYYLLSEPRACTDNSAGNERIRDHNSRMGYRVGKQCIHNVKTSKGSKTVRDEGEEMG